MNKLDKYIILDLLFLVSISSAAPSLTRANLVCSVFYNVFHLNGWSLCIHCLRYGRADTGSTASVSLVNKDSQRSPTSKAFVPKSVHR